MTRSRMQLHGRTRQQRYTKLADWDYVKQCVEAVRAREAEENRKQNLYLRYCKRSS